MQKEKATVITEVVRSQVLQLS